MMTNEQARIAAQASLGSYDGTPPVGYEFAKINGQAIKFDDPKTGFHAEIYQKIGSNEYIVAFTGTQPQTSQDVVADLALGTTQWNEQNKTAVFDAIAALPGATQITFTGHSLGGALAQYAAYDYVKGNSSHPSVSLATFNGPGGNAGLHQLHPDFDPSVAAQIDAAHFFANSSGRPDLVARLGSGHFAGGTYQIDIPPNLGLEAIHSPWDAFKSMTVPSATTAVPYLNIPVAQKLAGVLVYLGDDGTIDNIEGWIRAAGGFLVAASAAPASEINQLAEALMPGAAAINWGFLRDASPSLRLAFAIAGINLIGAGNLAQSVTQYLNVANEAALMAVQAVKAMASAAYEIAAKTGSNIATLKNNLDEASSCALQVVRGYQISHPDVTTPTPRNATVLDVNTDTTNVRPGRNAQFGANSNVSVGPAYVARMSHEMVNSDGLSNTLASANTAGKGRPGNLTPSNTEDIVNAIRGDSMTTTKTVAASIPDGVVSSHYEDIYPPYPGENAVPSHGYGLYNANGERIGYVATENANIGHRDSQGNWVTVHVAQAGKTYLFAKDADGKTVVTEMAPGSGSGTLLVNVKEGPNAEGMLNNGSAGARDPYTDPLVLDQGDDGVRFGGNPVSFDLDGDGREDTLSWTAPTDPVLVYDANGDNRVNDGSELIDLTEDGTPHNLITLDGNGDKVLNSDDDAYWQIQIWRDSNADGYASEQERQSLAEAGIVAIDLDPAHYKIGNVGGQTAVQGVEAIYGDGSKKMLWDVDFKERDAVTATTEYYAPGIDRISNGDQTALRITDSRGVAANLAGSAATQAIGGLGDDTLTGTAGDDWLIGSDGADKFQGGAGRDILVIDGEDLPSDIDGGADFDTAIVADDRGVMLNLYSANVEIVYGGYGNDVFVGGGADNYFIAGAAGDDLIVGGSADDALSGDDGDDVVSGGRGDDIIRGQRGDDNLSGGDGGDVLDGGIGDDVLDGGVGDDVFIASGGRDTVIGGAGRDTLQLRGALADYRFVRESGGYVVTDTRNADGTLVTAGNVSDRDGEQHISGIETFSYSSGQMSPYLNIDDVKPTPVADLVAIDGGLPCYIIEAATLTANDLDFQGGPLQISWVGEAIGGTVAMTSGLFTTITFTPTPGYVGPMQFSYRVKDPQGNGGVVIEIPEEPGSAAEIKGLVRLVQSDAPSDPDYVKQWHLGAVGALEAWREGYTGEGVKVLVLETSGKFAAYDQVADLNAADLAPNKSATFVDTEYHSTHATQVAGVIGAARNGVGGVGVAYDVTLDSKTIGFNLATMNARFEEMWQYDVVNNSWAFTAAWNSWAEDVGGDLQMNVVRNGIFDAILNGRDGRGTVLVYGAGNDRSKAFDAGTSPLTANPYSITVAALNRGGDLGSGISNSKPFSSRGANILVTAPGSNIFTTEIQATTNDGNVIGSPTAETQGTSFATPIVSAIAALMLQANSKLSYRDVQTILALTATRDFGAGTQATTTWYSNHGSDWNGAGMHYSHDFGFGMVDAAAAVRMAESWTPGTALPQMSDEVHAEAAALADLGSQVLSFDVTDTMDVEHVMLSLKLDHTRWSDFVVTLVSPTGTRSILLDRLGITASGDQAPNPLDVITFDKELMSTHFRGEGAEGIWQLIVEDKAAGGAGSSAIEASLKVYGEDGEVERYVLTDEYAGGWNLAPTTAKPSELNASAVGSAVRIDLAGGTSLVNGKALTVGTGIDTLISGSFNDTLSGSSTNETIIAGRGKDTVSAMGGADTLYGGKGDDSLDGGSDADRLYGDEDQDTLRGGDGGDRLDGGAGNDSLDGGAGKDLLVAGNGRDTLVGGADGDVFMVDLNGGETVTVADFNVAAGDVLALRNSLNEKIALNTISQSVVGNRLTLTIATDKGPQSIILEGMTQPLTGRQLKRLRADEDVVFNPVLGGFDASTVLVEPIATTKLVVTPKTYWVSKYGSGVIGDPDYWVVDTLTWRSGTEDDDILVAGGMGTKPAEVSDSNWAAALAGLGARRYNGMGGNDSLIGTADAEWFNGGADDDTIVAGGGNDTIAGGSGQDTFIFSAGAGRDSILDLDISEALRFNGVASGSLSPELGFHSDRYGFNTTVTLSYGSGNDAVTFSAPYIGLPALRQSDQTLYMAVLDASTEYGMLDGKTISAKADVVIQEKLGATSLNTLAGNDLVYAVVNTGLTISSDEGHDTVYALEGGTFIDGGAGNDSIRMDAATAAASHDTLVGGDGNDYILAGSQGADLYGDDLSGSLAGNDTLLGGAGNDTIHGGRGYDSISGGAGEDTIRGEDGNDAIDGGEGNNVVYGGSGDDSIRVGSGNNLVYGGGDRDQINGGAGADTVYGEDGDDFIYSQDGADVLFGGTGKDTLGGGAGDDWLQGDDDNDILDGWIGNDTLLGGLGADALSGGAGEDSLDGGDGEDSMTGGAGNDTLFGGTGNDVLSGGDGDDLLVGGTGNDVFETGSGRDVVWLNTSSGADTVSALNGVDTVILDGVAARGDVQLSLLDNGARVKLSWGSSNSLTLSTYDFSTSFQLDTEIVTLRQLFEAKGYHPDDSFDYVGAYDTQLRGDVNKIGTELGGSGNDSLYGGPDGASDPAYWYVIGRDGNDNLAGGISGAILDGGAGADKFLGTNGISVVRDTFHGGRDTLVMAPGMTPEMLRFYRIPNPLEAANLATGDIGLANGDSTYAAAPYAGAEGKVPNSLLPTVLVPDSRYIDNTMTSDVQHYDTLRIQSLDGKTTVDIVGFFADGAFKNDIANVLFPTVFDSQGYSTTVAIDALAGANVKGIELARKAVGETETYTKLGGVNGANYTASRDGQIVIGGEAGNNLKGRVKVVLNGSQSTVVSETEYAAYRSSSSSRDLNYLGGGSRIVNGNFTNNYYGYGNYNNGYYPSGLTVAAVALPDRILGFGGNDTIYAGGAYVETHYSGTRVFNSDWETYSLSGSTGFTRTFSSSSELTDEVNGGAGDDVYIYKRNDGNLHIVAIDDRFAGADGADILDLSAYQLNEITIDFDPDGSGAMTIRLPGGTIDDIRVDRGLEGAYQVDKILFNGGYSIDVRALLGKVLKSEWAAVDGRSYRASRLAAAPVGYTLPERYAPVAAAQIVREGSPLADLVAVPQNGVVRGYEGSDTYYVDLNTVDFAVIAMDRADAVYIGGSETIEEISTWNGFPFAGGDTDGATYLGKTVQQWLALGIFPQAGGTWQSWYGSSVGAVEIAQRGKLGRTDPSDTRPFSIADWHPVGDDNDDVSDALIHWQTTGVSGKPVDRYLVLQGIGDDWGRLLPFRNTLVGGDLYGTQGDDYLADLSSFSGANAPTGSDMNRDIFTLGGNDTVLAYAEDRYDSATRRYSGNDEGIHGGSGNDLLDGGAGSDALYGGTGDDSLIGGIGDDLLDGGAGRDTLIGGAGNDLYIIDADDLVVEGGSMVSQIVPEWTEMVVEVSATEAALLPKSADLAYDPGRLAVSWAVSSGPENSLRYFKHTIQWHYEQNLDLAGGIDEVRGALDIDLGVLANGNVENATLLGDAAHRLTGNAGANILTGNGAGSTLVGGDGDDVYIVGEGDTVLEMAGAGRDRLESAVDVLGLTANVEDLTSRGMGLNLIGNSLGNRIVGDNGNNLLDGGLGRDTLVGGAGNDSYYVNQTGDVVIEKSGGGRDTVYTSVSYSLADCDDIAANNIVLSRNGLDLILQIKGSTESLTLSNWGSGQRNYRVEFSDGSAWDNATLLAAATRLGGSIAGSSADDLLRAWDGVNETMSGLGGYDTLIGGSGNDSLDGGDGYDLLQGGGGADVLSGGAGYDALHGDAGNDDLSGGDGNDSLMGGSGNDTLSGGDGLDLLVGGEGDDSLMGGGGDDYLRGDGGNDTYVFNLGDGRDTLSDNDASTDNVDILSFGAGITAENLTLTSNGGDLIMTVGNGADQLTIQNFFFGNRYAIERVVFAGGGEWNAAEIAARAGSATVRGGSSADVLYAPDGSGGHVEGMGGVDSLFGGNGADILMGGSGNDTLNGRGGADTYVFNLGDGQDFIVDTGDVNDIDTLRFGTGIHRADITLKRNYSGLSVTIAGSSDSISFGVDNNRFAIERFIFDEEDGATVNINNSYQNYAGTVLNDVAYVPYSSYGVGGQLFGLEGNDYLEGDSYNDTLDGGIGNDTLDGDYGNDTLEGGSGDDSLSGSGGNDTLHGGSGNDWLSGGDGDDVYQFNLGDGQDTIAIGDPFWSSPADTLKFGTGITSDRITVSRSGSTAILSINGTSDQIYLQDWTGTGRVKRIIFGDNSEWSAAQVDSLLPALPTAPPPPPVIPPVARYLSGSTGNDTLYSYYSDHLNDTLDGGAGNDYLSAGDANHTYIFRAGDGEDLISDGGGTDTLRLIGINPNAVSMSIFDSKLVVDIAGTSDHIAFFSWWSSYSGIGNEYAIESIVFDGNDVRGASYINGLISQALSKKSSSRLDYGTSGNDVTNGTQYNDTLYGSYGNDSLLGGDGRDFLYGSDGNDTLVGGTGDDYIENWGSGSDVYIFNRGDGHDKIYDSASNYGGTDTIRFGTGIAAANLTFRRDDDDLIIDIDGGADQLRISRWGLSTNYFIERIEFTGGGSLSLEQILASIPAPPLGASGNDKLTAWHLGDRLQGLDGNDTLTGRGASDTLEGGDGGDNIDGALGNDSLLGGAGSDWLYGRGGNDTLIGDADNDTINGDEGDDVLYGNAGNDSLTGGAGSDTYVFSIGDGKDTISNYDVTGGIDTILLRGVTAADTTITLQGNDLVLTFANNSTDSLTLYYAVASGYYVVDRITFDDGSAWDLDKITELIYSGLPPVPIQGVPADQQNIILSGGSGNDTLNGKARNDSLSGGVGNDTLTGNDGDDWLDGGFGADSLLGGNGADTLIGGSGDDRLEGGNGADTYLIGRGSGITSIYDTGTGVDTLRFGEGVTPGDLSFSFTYDTFWSYITIDIAGSADQVKIYKWGAGCKIERIVFDDGRELNSAYVDSLAFAPMLGTSQNDRLNESLLLEGRALRGLDGNDSIYSNDSNSILDGGNGNDSLSGAGGNDTLLGGNDNDALSGGEGNDVLDGGIGNDVLYGDAGNDVLNGGAGNDTLTAGNGDDTILFNLGDGQDLLLENSSEYYSTDTLKFGTGILPGDVVVTRNGNDLIVTVGSGGDQIRIQSGMLSSWSHGGLVDRLVFADGTEWRVEKLALNLSAVMGNGSSNPDTLSGAGANDTLQGMGGDDRLFGNGGNDELYGGDNNDELYGSTGNDILDGGSGNDYLNGGGQDDTYIFRLGDGQDTINNWDYYNGISTVRFGAGITASQLSLARSAYDLVLSIAGTTDSIVFRNWSGYSDAGVVERFVFADDSVLELDRFKTLMSESVVSSLGSSSSEYIYGWAGLNTNIQGFAGDDNLSGAFGDDTLDGGLGNDALFGGAGNDTYIFNRGDGEDTLWGDGNRVTDIDVLHFGPGIVKADVSAVRVDYGLELRIAGSSDRIRFENWGDSLDFALDRIVFADGSEWSAAEILGSISPLVSGTFADDNVVGWGAADRLLGLVGDDRLEGLGGNDTFEGGIGNDTVITGTGDDVIIFNRGDGADTIYQDYSEDDDVDTLQFGNGITANDLVMSMVESHLLIQIVGTEDRILFDNWVSYPRVDRFRFADGSILLLAQNGADVPGLGTPALQGGNGSDTLHGGSGNDVLFGGGDTYDYALGDGSDTLQGGNAADTIDVIRFVNNSGVEEIRANSPLGLRLTGNRLDNRLVGNDGNDTLDGNGGADRMLGGDGSDEYIVDNAGDVVTEYANEGTDTVQSSVNYILGTNIENLTLTGGSGLAGTGNGLSNTLTGTNYDDTLTGAAGNDTLIGGAGYDTLVGGAGDDSYYVGTPETYFDVVVEAADEGIDTVYSEASANLSANVENLVLTGNTAIYASGNDLGNTLTGNVADNVFWGYGGDDTLIGGAGNDRYFVDDAGDVVVEKAGEGVDTVLTSVDYTLSDQVENMEAGWSAYAPIRLTGNALSNRIDGGSYADTLDGGLGADTLVGGNGNDTYLVDNAGDVVTETANQGTDLVLASVTVTALAANVENLTLTGTAALNGTGNTLNNTLLGNAASNQLYGGAGYDTLDGGAGADRLEGGADNDTYLVGDTLDTLIELAGQGTDTVKTDLASYTLLSNFENLILTGSAASTGIGNELGNVLTGNGAANRLEGRDGNDTLDGGAGQDDLLGGAGDDTYVVDNALDRVTELASEGTDTVRSAVAWTLGANLENLILTGSALNGYGNALNNVLTGNGSANRLEGYTGNDTLDGGGGNDTLLGGIGDDTYLVDSASDIVTELAGEGTDTVVSSASSYTLAANVENLKLVSSQYAYSYRTATGNALNNTIEGNAYMNILDGGVGADLLKGGNGDDHYVVDNQADQVIELAGEGADTVASSVSIAALADNVENLELSGSAAINGSGNSLNNYLSGNSGNNILDGLAGNDTLAGAAGSDTYRLGIGGGVDTISDYRYTVTDINTLEVAVTDAQVTVSNVGDGLCIGINGTSDAAVLENWFWDTNHQLNQIKFSNGVTWTPEQVEAHFVVANASAGSDVIYGSIGNDTALNGLGGNDTLYGRAGNDVLDGGTGDDYMVGGAGVDTYVINGFGQGEDQIGWTNTGEGTDDLVRFAGVQSNQATFERGAWQSDYEGTSSWWAAGSGLDIRVTAQDGTQFSSIILANFFNEDGTARNIIGSVQFDDTTFNSAQLKALATVLPTVGADGLYGFTAAETLDGGDGSDWIFGNGGADTLIGGRGNDYLEGTGTLDGGEGDDTLQVMYAYTTDAVHLVGGEGDDNLNGGYSYATASRTFEGGRGNDNLQVNGSGQNTVIYRAGDGKDTVSFTDTDHNDILRFDGVQKADLAFARSGNSLVIANLSDTEQQRVTVNYYFGYYSNSNADNYRPASIEVLDGATYRSLSVTDVLALAQAGSPLVDHIYGTAANDLLHGFQGNDIIQGADGNDTLYGDEGNDTLSGQNGNDFLVGGAGNDTLNGGAGTDTLVGGQGDDDYYWVDGTDIVTEAADEGIDTVSVSGPGTGTYTLGANIENLSAYGFAKLVGNAAENVITCWGDGITFDGGAGNDRYVGGYGGSAYLFGRGSGQDRVVDYDGYDSDTGYYNDDQASFGSGIAADQLWFRHVGNDLEVSIIGTADSLTIEHWYESSEYQVEQFNTADGKALSNAAVENLVQAMAAFAPPAAGQMTLPPAYQTALAPVVAANWH